MRIYCNKCEKSTNHVCLKELANMNTLTYECCECGELKEIFTEEEQEKND